MAGKASESFVANEANVIDVIVAADKAIVTNTANLAIKTMKPVLPRPKSCWQTALPLSFTPSQNIVKSSWKTRGILEWLYPTISVKYLADVIGTAHAPSQLGFKNRSTINWKTVIEVKQRLTRMLGK
jgi:hypothetical protein